MFSGDLRRYSDCRTAALKLIQENKESGIAENSPEIKSADRAKQQQGKENRKKAKMPWQAQRWEAWAESPAWEAWAESTPWCEAWPESTGSSSNEWASNECAASNGCASNEWASNEWPSNEWASNEPDHYHRGFTVPAYGPTLPALQEYNAQTFS